MKIRFDLQFIKDNWLYALLTSILSMFVSMLISYQFYKDFDRLLPFLFLTLIGCFLFLEFLLIIALQLWSNLIDVWFGNKKTTPTTEPAGMPLSNSFPIVQPVPVQMSTENYQDSNRHHDQVMANEKTELVNTLLAYVQHTMPPFVSEEYMSMLCEDIRRWSYDTAYRSSEPIRLKKDLTTNDLRHFIWNIGERLGQKNGYDGDCRARFVSSMFPEEFNGMDLSSIRNMRNSPHSGAIHIDEPLPGRYDFKYQREEQGTAV